MSARVPQSGGRPWVAVHTWMLNDPDVLLAGNAARAPWLSLLLWSAQAGTAGVVPADARRVATFARLDGGVHEVADALASLVAHGLLVAGPQDGTYAIGAWAETRADLGGSTTWSASTSAARFRSAHEAGKHSGGQRKGCALCDEGRPGLAVVPEPPGPDGGSPDGDSSESLPLGGGVSWSPSSARRSPGSWTPARRGWTATASCSTRRADSAPSTRACLFAWGRRWPTRSSPTPSTTT